MIPLLHPTTACQIFACRAFCAIEAHTPSHHSLFKIIPPRFGRIRALGKPLYHFDHLHPQTTQSNSPLLLSCTSSTKNAWAWRKIVVRRMRMRMRSVKATKQAVTMTVTNLTLTPQKKVLMQIQTVNAHNHSTAFTFYFGAGH